MADLRNRKHALSTKEEEVAAARHGPKKKTVRTRRVCERRPHPACEASPVATGAKQAVEDAQRPRRRAGSTAPVGRLIQLLAEAQDRRVGIRDDVPLPQ